MDGQIIFSTDAGTELARYLAQRAPAPSSIFLITPRQLHLTLTLPQPLTTIYIDDVEGDKSLKQCERIWRQMATAGATRSSLIINLGGGLTTDLGGLVAALYMRGIPYINVPTTLLAAVDASTGGKTAVNFAGVKNLIGAFAPPELTIISPQWFRTLPEPQILSGWAEMLKHALLTSPDMTRRLLRLNPLHLTTEEFLPLIRESVAVKQSVVARDPKETGLRRILNLGHTLAHALEAHAELRPTHTIELPHGIAVAYGLLLALYLSQKHHNFPAEIAYAVADYIRKTYPPYPFAEADTDALIALMHSDKKNRNADVISFTLLSSPGQPVLSHQFSDAEIKDGLHHLFFSA